MRYAEHARFLADNYRDLQGLRFVPLGVFFLIGAAWDASPSQWQTISTGVPMLGLFVAGIALYFVIGAFYNHRLLTRGMSAVREGVHDRAV